MLGSRFARNTRNSCFKLKKGVGINHSAPKNSFSLIRIESPCVTGPTMDTCMEETTWNLCGEICAGIKGL